MTDALKLLDEAGVSIWLDKLSRGMIAEGELAELVQRHVSGVTTNPTIFAHALSEGDDYVEQLRSLAEAGTEVEDAIFEITTRDVRSACDVLSETFRATSGQDGRASIEVQPSLAYDTEGTVAEVIALHEKVDRENVMVKIPATREGLPAITAATAAGVNINVTLIFSRERYRETAQAYVDGLRQAHAAGKDLSQIRSVASVFLSRIDTKVDAALEEIGTPEALDLRGRAAVANARLCYEIAEDIFGEAFADLRAAGAHAQRPLWASTGTKSDRYRKTLYVDTVIAPGVVNTMPPATMEAAAALETVTNTVAGTYDEARADLAALAELGVDLPAIMDELETEGIDAFNDSWAELTESVRKGLADGR